MKHIVSISLGSSRRDYTAIIPFLGETFTIRRIGTDGDITKATALIANHQRSVDAIGIDRLTPIIRIGTTVYAHPNAISLSNGEWKTPVVDGSVIRRTLDRWVVRQAAEQLPAAFTHRRILITSGLERYQLADALSAYSSALRFADPLLQTGLSSMPPLRSLKHLAWYAATMLPLLSLIPHRQRVGAPSQAHLSAAQRLFDWADIIAGDFETIWRFAPYRLDRRIILTDDPSPNEIHDLQARGVATLITMTPPMSDERPFVSSDILEAMIAVMSGTTHQPDEATVLDYISAAKWNPHIQHLNAVPKPRFAFVVHPLTARQISEIPMLRFTRHLPPTLVEHIAAYAPPVYISRIRGIRSKATGEEVEGFLLALGATPRQMMRHSPEFTYRRLVQAARMVERKGAQLMGLGAFTSVVGDAGITVAQRCKIGITTGNALTVAATLEAAKHAVRMMGGRIDRGRAVVIGATGSIGAVCARMLAMAIGDVVLIAPKPERLLLLKQQIERETPGAHIIAATNPDPYLADADLIVTTTTALNEHVLTIDHLKPGAVICDVARPPNVNKADAQRRPDVLIIESGEVRLPGEPDFGINIGLPPGVAYACLAETALLAMEGRFEDYTLGRNIEIDRAKEIYRLMKKHGLELAGLRSFGQHITEDDLLEKRRLADERRRSLDMRTKVLYTAPHEQAVITAQQESLSGRV